MRVTSTLAANALAYSVVKWNLPSYSHSCIFRRVKCNIFTLQVNKEHVTDILVEAVSLDLWIFAVKISLGSSDGELVFQWWKENVDTALREFWSRNSSRDCGRNEKHARQNQLAVWKLGVRTTFSLSTFCSRILDWGPAWKRRFLNDYSLGFWVAWNH